MKTSQIGVELICFFEGLKLKPYLCSAGKPTIGYGNTYYEDGTPVKLTDKPIKKDRAIELFKLILPKYEKIVTDNIKIPLKQNQFDALVSHTYNTGGSNGLFQLINNRANRKDIEFWFLNKYITGGGVVLRGLVARRKAEAKLYFHE